VIAPPARRKSAVRGRAAGYDVVMLWPADYHMHTRFAFMRGGTERVCGRAVAMGLTEIGFSDHSPMRKDNFDEWRMNSDKLSEYVENVGKARGISRN